MVMVGDHDHRDNNENENNDNTLYNPHTLNFVIIIM